MAQDENPQFYPLQCKIEGGKMIVSDRNGELPPGRLEVWLAPGVTSLCFKVNEVADGRYELRGYLRRKGGAEELMTEVPDEMYGRTLRTPEISLDAGSCADEWELKLEARPLPGNPAKPPTTVVIETKVHGPKPPESYMTGS
ncbi:MAG: hypothetical protein H6711_23160 [Myxococcales bacterium]|nr:hypothetical protein [Myxococcales bacterium]